MDYSVFDRLSFPVLVIDRDFRVVFKNAKASEVYGEKDTFCYTLSHGTDKPCGTQEGHTCPIDLLRENSEDHCGVLHVHRTLEGDRYFYVFAQRLNEETFLEFHIEISDFIHSLGFSNITPELLMSSGPIVFFLWENSEGWPVKVVSPNVANLFGYTAGDFLSGRVSYSDLIHPDDLPRVSEEVKRYTESKTPSWTHEDYRIITKDGKIRWVLDHTIAVFDDHRNITHYYGYIVDITDKHEQEELFRKLAESNPNGVILFDFRRNRIIYTNRAMTRITEYSEEELLSMKDSFVLIHPKDRLKVKKFVSKRLEGNKDTFSYDIRLVSKRGRIKWVKVISSVITYRGEECSLVTLIDITKEKLRERELHNLATRDHLTGVYNRHALVMFLEKFLSSAQRYKNSFSIILADIDNFKQVNDTFGHQVGDLVLKEFARIIKNSLRKTDVFGRWGGEEFLIILPFTSNPYPVAEKLRRRVEQHNFPEVGRITVSFGCTRYIEGDDLESMLIRADEALYEAKSSGKNRTVVL